jgi:diguanylate cyclase (GGDEF)-like protein
LLRQPIGRWLRAYQLSFVACAIVVVAIPGHAIHYLTLNYWQLWTIPILVIAPWLVLREARAGNGEARTLTVGLLIFIATCINDMMIDQVGLQNTRLIPYGLVAIMVTMSVSLANRFTAMLNELEDAVNERTAELSAANAQLAEAARVDPLTDLLNRRGFAEEADAEIQRVFRTGRGFTLILADVDNFKRFNDSHGHACGDHVLKRVADIFCANVRDVDRVARWGGEEFILLLPETELDGAATLAEKLRQTIADNLFEFDDQRLGITMTFGIASHRKGETLDACIARADTALYHGKERGRNKVMIGSYKGLTLVS